MGLYKGALLSFLKTTYPDLICTEHVSRFAYQRVFLDISSYIYKYLSIHGPVDNRWIHSIVGLIGTFVKNNVHVIPVFDGKPPPEKNGEIEERKEKKKKQEDRIKLLLESIQKYRCNNRDEETLQVLAREFENMNKKGKRLQRLLRASIPGVYSSNDLRDLEEYSEGLKTAVVRIAEEDTQFLKDLLEAMGVTYLQAPDESESYCCFLVRQGIGSAVVSCDTDCIAHRADTIVFSIEAGGVITTLETSELMQLMDFEEEEQMVDFAILVGCDYNIGPRVNKIGPVNAIKLLREHKRIENIPGLNTEVLKYEVCRRLFNPQYDTNVVVKSLETNEEELLRLCSRRRLNYDFVMESSKKKKKAIKFIDEE